MAVIGQPVQFYANVLPGSIGEPTAAIITGINKDGRVNLRVFEDSLGTCTSRQVGCVRLFPAIPTGEDEVAYPFAITIPKE